MSLLQLFTATDAAPYAWSLLRAGRDQRMPLLYEGARHKLDEMDRNHRHMAAAEHSDAALSLVLQQRQLLSQGVHPIKRRKI